MDKILLLDFLNSVHRARIVFGKKEESNTPDYTIVYNFFRNLRATLEEIDPSKVFIALEGKNNFRYALYPEYKANRLVKTGNAEKDEKKEATNKDIHRQKDIILRLLKSLPVTLVHSDNFEADDVIGTLAKNLKDEEVVILSSDTDFIQLLQTGYEHLSIYNPIKKAFMEAPEYHYATWKFCRGDKSDNVPSLMSDKKAQNLATNPELLKEFLLASEENKANYSLNQQLIELRTIPDEQLVFSEYEVDLDRVKSDFEGMDFKSMITDKYWQRFVDTFEGLI